MSAGGAPNQSYYGQQDPAGVSELDFALPVPLPLVWQRVYSSSQRQAGLLGRSWTTPLSIALQVQVHVDEVVVLDAFARDITFSLPGVSHSLYSPSERVRWSAPASAVLN